MKPRVGHIQFINCFPMYYGLLEKKLPLDIELIKGYPSDLNRMLKENLLDMAWIPSIAYARNYKDYVLLPDITVSSDGPVKSVFLFSKSPIETLDNRRIAMTNTSATSQALLRILMSKSYRSAPEYFDSTPEFGAMLMEAEAALLIGDDALRAYYKNKDRLLVYDLGQLWKDYTGLPMVFAVWAIRKEWADTNLDKIKEIHRVFLASLQYSLDNIEDAAKKAAQWEEFDYKYLVDYFNCLKYDFDLRKQKGLLEYYTQAHNLGLIEEVPPIDIIDVTESRR